MAVVYSYVHAYNIMYILNTCIYMYMYMQSPIYNAQVQACTYMFRFTDKNRKLDKISKLYTHTHTHSYIIIYMYMYITGGVIVRQSLHSNHHFRLESTCILKHWLAHFQALFLIQGVFVWGHTFTLGSVHDVYQERMCSCVYTCMWLRGHEARQTTTAMKVFWWRGFHRKCAQTHTHLSGQGTALHLQSASQSTSSGFAHTVRMMVPGALENHACTIIGVTIWNRKKEPASQTDRQTQEQRDRASKPARQRDRQCQQASQTDTGTERQSQ